MVSIIVSFGLLALVALVVLGVALPVMYAVYRRAGGRKSFAAWRRYMFEI